MTLINVDKCEYYNSFDKTCHNFCGDSPICNPELFECKLYIEGIKQQLHNLQQENEVLQEKLRNIQEVCKKEARVSTIDLIDGSHLNGKYMLANKILQIIRK